MVERTGKSDWDCKEKWLGLTVLVENLGCHALGLAWFLILVLLIFFCAGDPAQDTYLHISRVAVFTATFLTWLVLLRKHSTYFLFQDCRIWGTWPRLGVPTLQLFPGITQMTLILGPSQMCTQSIPREPKGHIPLCRKVRLSQMCLLLHFHRGSRFWSK